MPAHQWVIPALIAIVAALIANGQLQTARNKLKIDLFEKRMAVYQCVTDTLNVVASRATLTFEEQVKYLSGVQPARWLFGHDVAFYLRETLWREITQLETYERMLNEQVDSPIRTKYIKEKAELIQRLVGQFRILDDIFAEYLTLKH